MWTILEVFIEFITILLPLCFGYFGQEACEILAPWPVFEPAPSALEGEVLTTEQQGKSLMDVLDRTKFQGLFVVIQMSYEHFGKDQMSFKANFKIE